MATDVGGTYRTRSSALVWPDAGIWQDNPCQETIFTLPVLDAARQADPPYFPMTLASLIRVVPLVGKYKILHPFKDP